MGYPVVIQHDEMDCGAACLAMIGRYYGIKMPLIKYRNLLCFDCNGTTVYDIAHAAEKLNLEASCLKGKFNNFVEGVCSKSINLPCIALIKSDSFFHFVVIYKLTKKKIKYADPADGMHDVSFLDFEKKYKDVIITIKKTYDFKQQKIRTKTVPALVKQITDNKNLYIKLVICSIFIIALGLVGSVLIEFMVSSAISHATLNVEGICVENNDGNKIIEMITHSSYIIILLLVVIYGIRLIIECLKSFTITRIACDLEENMSLNFFDKMIKNPLKLFKGKKAGEYLSRFDDVRRLNNIFADVITVSILNITFAVGFGIALFIINIKLFIITIFVVLVFCIFTLLFQTVIKKINYTVLQNNSQIISVVEETTKGIELIKTFNLEKYIMDKFKSSLKKYVNVLGKFANLSFNHNNIANWISSFGVLIILCVGIMFCIRGEMEMDSLLVYYIILSNFMPAIEQLVYIQPEVSETIIAIDRVEDVLGTEIECETDGGERIETIESIELIDVSYSFGERRKVLTNASFKIEKGDKIRITGINGSGKSTLAHIIVGNYRDATGEIIYNGKKFVNYLSLKENITYVNQEVFLFHDSIYNNIVMGKEDISIEDFIKICEITGVNEFINDFPERYDYILCDNGMNLSGGQRRKIVLARALLRNTDMYIFDESTSNFDDDSEKRFLEATKQYLCDKTVLFISHNTLFEEYVSRTYQIEEGKLKLC